MSMPPNVEANMILHPARANPGESPGGYGPSKMAAFSKTNNSIKKLQMAPQSPSLDPPRAPRRTMDH